jgi:multicomponent Na+:H+ antiporter subunit F
MTGAEFQALSADIGMGLVIFGLVVAFLRLVRGPSLPDRVVALDMMTILIVSFCAIYAVVAGDPAFLDVAIVLALVGFLATVALARFAERRQVRGEGRRANDGGGG